MGTLSYDRIIKCILILGICSLLLTSCSNNQDETSLLNSSITDSTETVLNENSHLYSYYETVDLINSFMGKYIVLNSEGNDIVRRQEQILDCSEEGGELTSFYNNEELLRYQLIIYGAMERTEENYYAGNDFCYYTILNNMYESYPITKSKGEVLYYTFDEYWICGNESYRIDRAREQLIPCEENPISPIILKDINTGDKK